MKKLFASICLIFFFLSVIYLTSPGNTDPLIALISVCMMLGCIAFLLWLTAVERAESGIQFFRLKRGKRYRLLAYNWDWTTPKDLHMLVMHRRSHLHVYVYQHDIHHKDMLAQGVFVSWDYVPQSREKIVSIYEFEESTEPLLPRTKIVLN
jgi:hypothetical protein